MDLHESRGRQLSISLHCYIIELRLSIYLCVYLCVHRRSEKRKRSPRRAAAAAPRRTNVVCECNYLPIWAARSKSVAARCFLRQTLPAGRTCLAPLLCDAKLFAALERLLCNSIIIHDTRLGLCGCETIAAKPFPRKLLHKYRVSAHTSAAEPTVAVRQWQLLLRGVKHLVIILSILIVTNASP